MSWSCSATNMWSTTPRWTPHLADQMGVKRGLRNLDGTGVLAGITNVSNVVGYDKKEDGTIVPIPGRLVYRGIDIGRAGRRGRRPATASCLRRWSGCCCSAPCPRGSSTPSSASCWSTTASCPSGFADDMILNSPSPNLMNKMARSVLAMYSYDEHAEDN